MLRIIPLAITMCLLLLAGHAPAKTIPLAKGKPQVTASPDGACAKGTFRMRSDSKTYCLSCPKGFSLLRGVGTKDGQRRYYYYCSGCPAGYSKKKINNKWVCWAPDPPPACYGLFKGRWLVDFYACRKNAGIYQFTAHRWTKGSNKGKIYGRMVRISGKNGCGLTASGGWSCKSYQGDDGSPQHKIELKFKTGGSYWLKYDRQRNRAVGRDRIKGIRIYMYRR